MYSKVVRKRQTAEDQWRDLLRRTLVRSGH